MASQGRSAVSIVQPSSCLTAVAYAPGRLTERHCATLGSGNAGARNLIPRVPGSLAIRGSTVPHSSAGRRRHGHEHTCSSSAVSVRRRAEPVAASGASPTADGGLPPAAAPPGMPSSRAWRPVRCPAQCAAATPRVGATPLRHRPYGTRTPDTTRAEFLGTPSDTPGRPTRNCLAPGGTYRTAEHFLPLHPYPTKIRATHSKGRSPPPCAYLITPA